MVDDIDSKDPPDHECEVGGAPKMGILVLEPSSVAGCSNTIGENHASSSQSCFKKAFIDMGFPSILVDKVLEEKGEENAELLLETLCAYSDVGKPSHDSSDSLDEILGDSEDEGKSADFCTNISKIEGHEMHEVNEDKRASLLMMKFSMEEVDFALDKLGENPPLNELVDFIVAAQIANSGVDNEKNEEKNTETLFWTMDMTLRLLEMGFSENEISSAIEKYSDEIPIEELADSIFADRMANTCFHEDEDQSGNHRMNCSHGDFYRTKPNFPKEEPISFPQEDHSKRRSFNTVIAETAASSSKAFHGEDIDFNEKHKGKKMKFEYEDYSDALFGTTSPEAKSVEPTSTRFSMSLPQELLNLAKGGRSKFPQQPETDLSGGIRQMVANRPYFFYGNVLDVSRETWKQLSQFLFTIAPEFVNTQFFSALSRKEGYIHNLPKDDRSYILPRSPMSIEDALPHTKEWWPSWDTRKQLSCINTETKGLPHMCERLGRILIDSQGLLTKEQQTDILHHCKALNLMWVGQYELNPIEPEQVERILGYPAGHTQSLESDPVQRRRLLKHGFQTDTLGYHLSPLKWIFPHGLTILSLYSGIGGAEIAIHRLGLHLKGVVSVEFSEANRRIFQKWWQSTQQVGKLVQIENINKLTSTRVNSLIDDFGGFDLVICQHPFSDNLPGSSNVSSDRENPAGFDIISFYEFSRILQIVRSTMGGR